MPLLLKAIFHPFNTSLNRLTQPITQKLEVIDGPAAGRSFPLIDSQTLKIGRGQTSDRQLDDGRMIRVHCISEMVDGKARLKDTSSTGGTFVGDEQITQRELINDLDKIGMFNSLTA